MDIRASSIAVVIATKGRPHVLAETLASVARQSLLPGQVIISASCADDLPAAVPASLHVESIVGQSGLPVQRNAARLLLRQDAGIVFLLDDDIELATDYLEQIVQVFNARPEIGLLGGSCSQMDLSQEMKQSDSLRKPQLGGHQRYSLVAHSTVATCAFALTFFVLLLSMRTSDFMDGWRMSTGLSGRATMARSCHVRRQEPCT
jgi:GT2 family glycosyltransferase